MLQCQYQWNVKHKKLRRDIQNTYIYANIEHRYICRYRVNQHLIVMNLYSISINKILVTEFITVKYVNTMKSTS